MSPVLGYWNVRGVGEPIRYMLVYLGIDYKEKLYYPGGPPEWSRKDWEKERSSLGLEFPNLPYYIDGDIKLTQSLAIMRYIARKMNLDANTEEERIRADMVEKQLDDMRWGLIRTCYVPAEIYINKRKNYMERLPEQVKLLSQFLDSRQWLLGDRLTYVDFLCYETLDHYQLFEPDCLKKYPNLLQYMVRFQQLPAIKNYMESDKFKWYPLFAPFFMFGGEFSPNKPEKALEKFPNSYIDMGYSFPYNYL